MSLEILGATFHPVFPNRQFVIACPCHDTTVALKMNERTANLYENKGPTRKTDPQSRNAIENKGT
jgi:hypothetical protein